MKKNSISIIRQICLISLICLSPAAFALDPATAIITNFHDEAEAYILDSTGAKLTCYHNAPLLLTNCIAFAGATTNSARLNLTGVTSTLKLGTSTSNFSYTVYAANATNGTWWALISSVPTNWTEAYIQLKCTNSATIFIYPWKILKTKSPL
jgi:hypothetical protein